MSRLEEINAGFRAQTLVKNGYKNNDEYNSGHENALSDGDELGKGELNGQVGSATDIRVREKLKAKNKYNNGNEYNASNA